MSTKTELSDDLTKLANVLRKRALSARAIARIFHVTRPTAYARVKALQEHARVKTTQRREGKSGPLATVYAVA